MHAGVRYVAGAVVADDGVGCVVVMSSSVVVGVDGSVVDATGGGSSPTGANIVMPMPMAIDAKRIVNHSASVGRRWTGSVVVGSSRMLIEYSRLDLRPIGRRRRLAVHGVSAALGAAVDRVLYVVPAVPAQPQPLATGQHALARIAGERDAAFDQPIDRQDRPELPDHPAA